MPVPVAPTIRGQMAAYMAGQDHRCANDTHAVAMQRGHTCPVCHLTLADYVRALDVVMWP